MSIRLATVGDVPRILEIYGPYVENTAFSLEYTVPTLAEFTQRFSEITAQYPWLVWEENDTILGYAYGSRPFQRAAYQWSAGVSIYLCPEACGKGIGKKLYAALEQLLQRQGYRKAYAVITTANAGSVAFHRAVGYHHTATMPDCAYKMGAWHGTIWMEKDLNMDTPPRPLIPIHKLHKTRCAWCNTKNPKYVEYHDNEWCQPRFDDPYLYEMLILESFQAGLSWECVLNKRESFRLAYDGFDLEKVCAYGDSKIGELLENKDIIRNKLKIKASIRNSQIFRAIVGEYGSFYRYLTSFAGENVLYETNRTTNALSDAISRDLQKRGMTFVGSTIIYSYLQAIGLIYSHDPDCYLYSVKATNT